MKQAYAKGIVCKEEFAEALRAHQAAVDATKSPQRTEADAVLEFAAGKEAACRNVAGPLYVLKQCIIHKAIYRWIST